MKQALGIAVLLLPVVFGCQAQSQAPLFRPAPGEPIRVDSRPSDLAVADLNGDGRLDLLTTNTRSNNISVLLGNGRGEFRAAPRLAAGRLRGDAPGRDRRPEQRPHA